jgi:hypothetical protein
MPSDTRTASESSGNPSDSAGIDAVLGRMPADRGGFLGIGVIGLLLANGLVVSYLIRGIMTPLELVVLVALEALLLSLIVRLQYLFVPRKARPVAKDDGGSKLVRLVFVLAWLAITYYLVFWIYFGSGDSVSQAWQNPAALLAQPQILWPLLITLVGAVLDAVQDHVHFRQRGGQFVSLSEFGAMARWLTLILGAIPFLIPLLALAMGIATGVKIWEGRQRSRPLPGLGSVFMVFMVVAAALVVALSATIIGLFKMGVAGWAIGYVSAKIASEALVLAIPHILARIKDEPGQPAQPSS